MSTEKMCWARRQFPARLASLILLLFIAGLNLLLWQVKTFHLSDTICFLRLSDACYLLLNIKVQQDYEALKEEQDLEKQREAKPFLEATFSFNMTEMFISSSLGGKYNSSSLGGK